MRRFYNEDEFRVRDMSLMYKQEKKEHTRVCK